MDLLTKASKKASTW